MIDPELLKRLGNPLEADRPGFRQIGRYLVCPRTGVGYPIVNGIPHLLPGDVIPFERMKELLDEQHLDEDSGSART